MCDCDNRGRRAHVSVWIIALLNHFFTCRLLRADFFVRAERVDLKHIDTSTSSGDPSSSGGKEGKTTLRKRGEKGSDSPRPKKQVSSSPLKTCLSETQSWKDVVYYKYW